MNRFIMQRRIAVALLSALSVGGVLILLDGHNPFEAYKVLFLESFLNYWGFSNTLVKALPMLLAGLAVIIPMRAGVFNIGGEGQILYRWVVRRRLCFGDPRSARSIGRAANIYRRRRRWGVLGGNSCVSQSLSGHE